MSVHRKALSFIASCLLFFSCGPDKSTYVDVPSDHGDELKINASDEADLKLKAGNYGNLILAIDTNKVTALYTKDGQSCYFFETEFTKYSAESALKWRKIGSDEKGDGKFIAEPGAVWIQLSGKASGCAPDLFKSAQKMPISKINNWKKISAVDKNLVEISSEPLEGMKIGQSFKKGDIICILEEKNDWLRVEKIAKSAQVGWIKAADINHK
jgi:hypothetical protein